MRKIRTMHLEHLTVSEDTQFYGMAADGVTVAPGVRFELHGMVNGDVTAGDGAAVEIYGMLSGKVIGGKAHVHVYGLVS
ncbi:hypothetical protein [Roseibium litorale]|uniref:Polymer-forming cytoskeletal protein n=1 Tax=Roseibium litorale TaxID=2803841 RepID=A0ABR9CTP0_9HYPH|nr:hypothetical protein [Roseibium litorale]MBD8894215.1 hypothetical protein [Roseibium litorale]